MFWKRKRQNNNEQLPKKARTLIELKTSELSRNLALSPEHIQHLYTPIFIRLESLLTEVNQTERVEPVMVGLIEMMRYRRGVTLPSGITPEQVQRYREISSYTLTLVVVSRTVAHILSTLAVECDAHGMQKFHNPLFTNQIKNEKKRIGITSAEHATVGLSVEKHLAQWIASDLLSKCPTGLGWYASFPDMFNLLLEAINGTEKGLLGDVAEKYIDRILQQFKEKMPTNADKVVGANTDETQPNMLESTTTSSSTSSSGVDFLNKMITESMVEPDEENNEVSESLNTLKSMAGKNDTSNESNGQLGGEPLESGKSSDEAEESSEITPAMSKLLSVMNLGIEEEEKTNGENSQEVAVEEPQNCGRKAYFDALSNSFINELRLTEIDGQTFLAVGCKTHREVVKRTFGHLNTVARKAAEEALLTELKAISYLQDEGLVRLRTHTGTNSERFYLFSRCMGNGYLIDDANEMVHINRQNVS